MIQSPNGKPYLYIKLERNSVEDSVLLDRNGIGQTTIDDFGIFVPPPGVISDTMIFLQLDGDIQWEVNIGYLWSLDNQQLDSLTFDPQTNILTAFLENGGSKSVDLSSLNNSGTDSQTLSLSNDSIFISNGNGGQVYLGYQNPGDRYIYYDAANQQIILSIENGGTVFSCPTGLTGATEPQK